MNYITYYEDNHGTPHKEKFSCKTDNEAINYFLYKILYGVGTENDSLYRNENGIFTRIK